LYFLSGIMAWCDFVTCSHSKHSLADAPSARGLAFDSSDDILPTCERGPCRPSSSKCLCDAGCWATALAVAPGIDDVNPPPRLGAAPNPPPPPPPPPNAPPPPPNAPPPPPPPPTASGNGGGGIWVGAVLVVAEGKVGNAALGIEKDPNPADEAMLCILLAPPQSLCARLRPQTRLCSLK